jgi:hypothetical protein
MHVKTFLMDFQMGKGRTTTGMILACLIKDILFGDTDKIYYKDSGNIEYKVGKLFTIYPPGVDFLYKEVVKCHWAQHLD